MAYKLSVRHRIERFLERPIIDYIGSAVVIAVVIAAAHRWHSVDTLRALKPEQRADLYSKVFGPLSIVASVGLAGLAVYSSGQGTRMSLLRALYGRRLLKQFRGAAAAPGVAVLALITAYVAEVGHNAGWARWLAVGSIVFVLFRSVRVLYFYTGLLESAGADKDPEPRRPSIDDPVRRS